MAKPKSFPRKFRQKLERMRDERTTREREERLAEIAAMPQDELDRRVSHTCLRDFLQPGMVELTHFSADEQHMRLTSTHSLELRRRVRYVTAIPPWDTHLPEPSPNPASE